ncbi:MAG TPA: transporter, partial [Chromatiaceae bacterium]|nr:transporter [Chromatiaceae bacterium]
MKVLGLALLGLCLFQLARAQSDPFSQPLSLERALHLARQSHPTIELARAREAAAEARLQQVMAENGLSVSLVGRLAWLEPAELSGFQDHNDSSAHLLMSKRLYDFGYSKAQQASASSALAAVRSSGLEARQQQQLEVMKAFFDVLLADLEYARDNEAMAIAFVRLDKARSRHELGRLSDVELLKLETRYQQSLSRRSLSQGRQRSTRLRLALAMNRPDR